MITLDRASPISLYEQLYRELKKAIISGELPPGKQLPSTRALALQYDISRNTVNTAYSQLLVEGFITSRPGSGFYVEKIPLPVTLNQTTPSAIPEAQSPSCTYDFFMGVWMSISIETEPFDRPCHEPGTTWKSGTVSLMNLPQEAFISGKPSPTCSIAPAAL